MTGDFDQLKLILRATTILRGLLSSILVSINAGAAPQNETPAFGLLHGVGLAPSLDFSLRLSGNLSLITFDTL